MKNKENKTLCQGCANYSESACGSVQTCWANLKGSLAIPTLSDDYMNNRINGNLTTCKEFKKI
jgi:hypothetical protein